MVQTKETLSTDLAASGITAETDSTTAHTEARRQRVFRPRLGGLDARTVGDTPRMTRPRQTGHFLLHYFEMCIPMCIGFAVGDLVYFWAAGQQGYSEAFRQLPELSVLVVTFTMTAPMTAWMVFRGMPRRATVEMSAAMPVLALVLLALGWLTIVPMADLALLEHGLMMPVMLAPMFLRFDLYTGRRGHTGHHGQTSADADALFSSDRGHRPVLATARRGWPLGPTEWTHLRGDCGGARTARSLRPPLRTRGARAGGTVRDRAGTNRARRPR